MWTQFSKNQPACTGTPKTSRFLLPAVELKPNRSTVSRVSLFLTSLPQLDVSICSCWCSRVTVYHRAVYSFTSLGATFLGCVVHSFRRIRCSHHHRFSRPVLMLINRVHVMPLLHLSQFQQLGRSAARQLVFLKTEDTEVRSAGRAATTSTFSRRLQANRARIYACFIFSTNPHRSSQEFSRFFISSRPIRSRR